jgi:hypothetical protein
MIIAQLPAELSRLATWSGGSISDEVMVLSHAAHVRAMASTE